MPSRNAAPSTLEEYEAHRRLAYGGEVCFDCSAPLVETVYLAVRKTWVGGFVVGNEWWLLGDHRSVALCRTCSGYDAAHELSEERSRENGWLPARLRYSRTLLVAERGPCVSCGRRVISLPPNRRQPPRVVACSDRCRDRELGRERAARNARQRERACAVCGDRFAPARRDARYCSNACRQDAYRKRRQGATPGTSPREEGAQ